MCQKVKRKGKSPLHKNVTYLFFHCQWNKSIRWKWHKKINFIFRCTYNSSRAKERKKKKTERKKEKDLYSSNEKCITLTFQFQHWSPFDWMNALKMERYKWIWREVDAFSFFLSFCLQVGNLNKLFSWKLVNLKSIYSTFDLLIKII